MHLPFPFVSFTDVNSFVCSLYACLLRAVRLFAMYALLCVCLLRAIDVFVF